jgi:hypothetical protein
MMNELEVVVFVNVEAGFLAIMMRIIRHDLSVCEEGFSIELVKQHSSFYLFKGAT